MKKESCCTEQNTQQEECCVNDELVACQQESALWKEKFIRAAADLENYQKRITKERSIWVEQAQSDILLDVLSIIDDYERALLHHRQQESEEHKQLVKGFELIYTALYKMLDKYGIKEITETKTFDPELHEAIAQVESVEFKSGDIVEVVQKGFTVNERVLRHAKVAVAK